MQKACFIDRWGAYVATSDTSPEHVLISMKWRHVQDSCRWQRHDTGNASPKSHLKNMRPIDLSNDHGANIEVGDNFYANFNLTILDAQKVVRLRLQRCFGRRQAVEKARPESSYQGGRMAARLNPRRSRCDSW